MKVRELSLDEFGRVVRNRYRLGIDDTRRLKSEFDAANATYQMVHKANFGNVGGDSKLAQFIAELEQTANEGVLEQAKGAAQIMGAESLYGALFLHSKLCITDPSSHCAPTSNDWEDVQAAKYGTLFLEHLNNHLELADKLENTVYLDTCVFGNGIMYVGWDHTKGTVETYDKETGEFELSGDFDIRRVSPYSFIPQPGITNLRDAEWCFEKHDVTVEELCYSFPDKADKIREFHKETQQVRKSDSKYSTVEDSETLTVIEYWEKHLPWNGMHGRHAIFLTRQEDDTANKEPVMKCILVEANPYNHGELPYVMLSDVDVAGSLWGLGRLTICVPLQETIDRILSICYDNSELHGQIHLVVPDGTHNPDNLRTDDPTHVFKFNAAMANGQKPMQMQPSMVSSDFWRQYDIYRGQIESIYGAGEFSQGEINRELSGFAVLTAIDADDKFRVRLFNKKVQMLKDMYRKLLSIGQQFLDDLHTVRVVGQERMAQAKVFKMADLKGNYDIKVGFGRFMPTDPSAAKEYMFQLLQTGLFQEAGGDPKKLASLLIDGNLIELQNYQDGAKAVQDSEIIRMMGGEQMPVYEYMDHAAHLEILNEFMNTNFFEAFPPDKKAIFEAHAKAHVDVFAELSAKANPPGAEEEMQEQPM